MMLANTTSGTTISDFLMLFHNTDIYHYSQYTEMCVTAYKLCAAMCAI